MDVIKASPIELRATMPTSEAFHDIFQSCLYQANANCKSLQITGKARPETVHQARVGMRRARSALALFRPLAEKDQRKRVGDELQKAGRHLAPCRDWDVFVAETLRRIEKRFSDEVDIQTIRDAASEQQTKAYRNLDMDSMVTATTHVVDVADSHPIAYWAGDLLDEQFFAVRSRCRHIGSAEDRHSLRKSMKKLRYAVEFLGSLFDNKQVHSFVNACKDMQEVLGKMNDAAATIHLLNDLHLDEKTIAVPLSWAQQHEERAEHQLTGAIDEFRLAKPFWD